MRQRMRFGMLFLRGLISATSSARSLSIALSFQTTDNHQPSTLISTLSLANFRDLAFPHNDLKGKDPLNLELQLLPVIAVSDLLRKFASGWAPAPHRDRS